MRESPSTIVIDELEKLGLNVDVTLTRTLNKINTKRKRKASRKPRASGILVFLTDHNEFKELDPSTLNAKTKSYSIRKTA